MGNTFPTGPSPVFPPSRWECPKSMGGCGKTHDKPHFPWPNQIDFSKKPGEVGRVTFNRADENDALKGDTPTKQELVGKQAPMYQKGKLQALFCPHCGFTMDGILLVVHKTRKTKTSTKKKAVPSPVKKKDDANIPELSAERTIIEKPAPKKSGVRSMLERVGIKKKKRVKKP